MYAVILAGGSGTRLWPLSREQYPKQFLPLPGVPSDQEERKKEVEGLNREKDFSLIEATVDRVMAAVPEDKVIIVTHVDQADEIRRRLKEANLEKVRILEEPQARNTAPAIGLAAYYLQKEAGPDSVMAV
ncbi:MAG: sugar phosphate nucleotidyltransferase, partial [Bacillota bacterium]